MKFFLKTIQRKRERNREWVKETKKKKEDENKKLQKRKGEHKNSTT